MYLCCITIIPSHYDKKINCGQYITSVFSFSQNQRDDYIDCDNMRINDRN